MNDPQGQASDLTAANRIDMLCDKFEQEWVNKREPALEYFLSQVDAGMRLGLFRELLKLEVDYRTRGGLPFDIDDYTVRFPEFANAVAEVLAPYRGEGQAINPPRASATDQGTQTHPSSHPGELTAIGQTSTSSGNSDSILGSTLGPYRLLAKLGQGGMGAVFKARHEHLDKIVAIKILPQHFTRQVESVARFKREMKAVGRLNHPNIVQAFDAGEVGGTHYLAMEFVEGTDLLQLVRTHGPLTVSQACDVIRQAALALEAAHKLGQIHRDIKPANLLLADSGQIKLLDLGLSLLGDPSTGSELTTAGQTFGTPDFMAPEQWKDAHAADARADLYALGCTLYFLLVGRAPYATDRQRTPYAKMYAHINDQIPSLVGARSDVPEGLSSIYLKLMSKHPDQRIQTATELAHALTPITGSNSIPVAEMVADSRVPFVADKTPHSNPKSLTGSSTSAVATPSQTVTHCWHFAETSTLPLKFGLAVVAVLLLGTIYFTFKNPIRITPKGIGVGIMGKPIDVVKSGERMGSNSAEVAWQGWPIDAPLPAIAPFNGEQAKQHQQAWAKYLGVSLEHTNTIGMKFMLIPPGEFMMGSSPDELAVILKHANQDPAREDLIKSEGPRHRVILTQPYYLGIHEVTQGQYEEVMGNNPSHFSASGAVRGIALGTDTSLYPVETLPWANAVEFCEKLSRQEKRSPIYSRDGDLVKRMKGNGYRMPTEAEWEFACRAGTVTKFSAGDQDEALSAIGWHGGNSQGRTHVVGELQANAFGLFDTHGNVWEWVDDWWEPNYDRHSQMNPAINPNSVNAPGTMRVVRGGNWNDPAYYCRSADRHAYEPTNYNGGIGFRVALEVDVVKKARESAQGSE